MRDLMTPCPYRVGRGTDLVGPTSGCQCPDWTRFVSIENYNVDQLDFGAWLSSEHSGVKLIIFKINCSNLP